jgi:Domain of unknown function (DUF4384)
MTGSGRAAALLLILAAGGCTTVGRTTVFSRDLLTDAQQVIADTQINHGEMTITASVDHPDRHYDVGQPITVSATVSDNAYVAILRVLANGDTAIVFPNKAHPKADVAAGKTLTVPGPDDAVTVTVDKPQVVLFEFVASSVGDAWLFTRKPDEGSDFADLGGTTRALAKDIVNALKVGKGPQTVASYVVVRVGSSGLF